MKVEIRVYEEIKYIAKEEPKTVEYDIEGFKIVGGGNEAKEIESHPEGSCIDEFHEYLILTFKDGTTGTFRNSHVDMFKLF